jgi:hypothetical protein
MDTEAIFCDMTGARDTPAERLEEYRSLFAHHHLRREDGPADVRHTFRNGAGVADHVRDLTDREQACCGFLDFAVTEEGAEVHWDIRTHAGPMAEAVVEEFRHLVDALPGRAGREGLQNPV